MPPHPVLCRAARSAASCLLLLAFVAAPLRAQGDGLPELNSLKPSSAPAFILLGVAPASVERPQTPADVAFSLVNQTQSFSTIPQNYAAEFAPYWLFSRPTLTWQDDTTRTMGQSFRRTGSISLATAQLGTETDPVSGVGFGANAYLLSGKMSPQAQARMRQIEDYLAARDSVESALAAADLLAIQALGTRISAAFNAGDTATARILSDSVTLRVNAARLAAQQDSVFILWEQNHPLEQLQEATPQRVGLFWGVAAGASWGFADGAWAAGHVRNIGVWTTLSYEGTQASQGTTFTPMAVARLLSQRGDSAMTTLDAGGRFVLSAPTYSASVEGIVRLPLETENAKNLYRLAGILEYRLRPDLWLTATFGRDYQSQESGSLLAQLGVKFHVTEDRYVPPPPPPANGGS
jgi:hypothetical protein